MSKGDILPAGCSGKPYQPNAKIPTPLQILTMSNNSIRPRNPLLIPELFYCVLGYLITHCREERRTLAALARTCRAFSEPSLNRLWRRLNSLLPLARCFSNVVDEARVKV